MVSFHRISRAKTGKFPEAVQWAKETAGYINASFISANVTAYFELFGDVGAIHWYADLEDLAEVDRLNAWAVGDQGYQARLKNGADIFIEGSTYDKLVQMI